MNDSMIELILICILSIICSTGGYLAGREAETTKFSNVNLTGSHNFNDICSPITKNPTTYLCLMEEDINCYIIPSEGVSCVRNH